MPAGGGDDSSERIIDASFFFLQLRRRVANPNFGFLFFGTDMLPEAKAYQLIVGDLNRMAWPHYSGRNISAENSEEKKVLFRKIETYRRCFPIAARTKVTKRRGRRPSRGCLLYTSPSPRDRTRSRMPSSA